MRATLAAVVMCLAGAAETEARSELVSEPLLRAAMAFAVAHTGLPPLPEGVLPSAVIARAEEIHNLWRPGTPFDPEAAFQVRALYLDPPTGGPAGTMLFIEGWTPHTDKGLAILVHEMVHALQYGAGVRESARCVGELERDAYDTQKAFLRALGHDDPHEAMDTNPLAVALISQCPRYEAVGP